MTEIGNKPDNYDEVKFPCTGCGICCTRVEGFPLPQKDGVCDWFDPAKRNCTIYETRPLVCRIDDGMELFWHKDHRWEWHIVNANKCNQWINRANKEGAQYDLVKIGE